MLNPLYCGCTNQGNTVIVCNIIPVEHCINGFNFTVWAEGYIIIYSTTLGYSIHQSTLWWMYEQLYDCVCVVICYMFHEYRLNCYIWSSTQWQKCLFHAMACAYNYSTNYRSVIHWSGVKQVFPVTTWFSGCEEEAKTVNVRSPASKEPLDGMMHNEQPSSTSSIRTKGTPNSGVRAELRIVIIIIWL